MVLQSMFGSNTSAWNEALESGKHNDCPVSNDTMLGGHQPLAEEAMDGNVGQDIYAFLTPFIILIGIIGHCISLIIFTSPALRRLSASFYLAAISTCDILVLLTYVMLDWFKKGLLLWPGGVSISIIDEPGFCEVFLFLAYTFRFISVWLIVVFTVERFIAVCRPLHRRLICTKSFSRRIILTVTLTALVLSLYKPILSRVIHINGDEQVCAGKPEHHQLNFALDSIYGLLITAVPFVIITIFNFIILKRLLSRDILDKHAPGGGAPFRGNLLRLEFTVILLAISSCFVCLNIPYLIVWVRQVLLIDSLGAATTGPRTGNRTLVDTVDVLTQHALGDSTQLYLTKTVFYFNYCVNFFMYCLTGRQYREQIRCLFRGRRGRGRGSLNRLSSFSTQHSIVPPHANLHHHLHHGGNGQGQGHGRERIAMHGTRLCSGGAGGGGGVGVGGGVGGTVEI